MNPLSAALRFWKLRAGWLGDGGQPVPLPHAQARASVCLQCPKNQAMPLWETLSAPLALQLRRTIQLKASMQLAVPGEDGLHTCAACGCHLPTKVWAPLRHIIATTPLADLHPDCWILAEKRAATTK